MTSGGARAQSGPPPDPRSLTSDRRGYKPTSLPASGYDGPAPDFPLPQVSEREQVVWADVWRTPQACAWAKPSQSWRLFTIAMYVRTFVRCEAEDAKPMLLAQLHRFADQIGLTPGGLARNGWQIVEEPTPSAGSQQTRRPSARDRMTVVENSAPVRRLRG